MKTFNIINKCPRIVPILLIFIIFDIPESQGLKCYQCERKTNTECSENELLPCAPSKDVCVTHINNQDGYLIKRECGLGPCKFSDSNANRALGLDSCDINKNNFCISCCREDGCNKSHSNKLSSPSFLLLICIVIVIVLINVHYDFQPPYVSKGDKYFF